nr:uncharacterized protein LOC113695830 [Coffea arabica]
MSNDETTRPVMGYAPVGCPQPFPPPQQGYYGHPYTAYPNYYNGAGPPPGTVYYSSAQLPNISPQPSKDFKVESFNVPYFDIANSTLKARWETNITVKSTNQKSRISFPHIQGYLVYRNRLVDAAMIDPLHLEGKTEASLRANFSLPDPRGNLPKLRWWMQWVKDEKLGFWIFI